MLAFLFVATLTMLLVAIGGLDAVHVAKVFGCSCM